jgi:hypothetical protein
MEIAKLVYEYIEAFCLGVQTMSLVIIAMCMCAITTRYLHTPKAPGEEK